MEKSAVTVVALSGTTIRDGSHRPHPRSIARTEAVRPVPRKGGSPQRRGDIHGCSELCELSGPARERAVAETSYTIECAVAERGVVARARRVDDDVAVHQCRTRRRGIDDGRADFDLLEVRGRDRAEGAGETRVRRALLCHMELSASR